MMLRQSVERAHDPAPRLDARRARVGWFLRVDQLALPLLLLDALGPERPPARHPLAGPIGSHRSEEHTSELQSHHDLVCRLLLEKKKTIKIKQTSITELRP